MYLAVLFLFVLTCLSITGSQRKLESYFTRDNDKHVTNSSVRNVLNVQTYSADRKLICLAHCNERGGCQVAAWNDADKVCEISTVHSFILNYAEPDLRDGWTLFVRRQGICDRIKIS